MNVILNILFYNMLVRRGGNKTLSRFRTYLNKRDIFVAVLNFAWFWYDFITKMVSDGPHSISL